jgi:hypothetical protein
MNKPTSHTASQKTAIKFAHELLQVVQNHIDSATPSVIVEPKIRFTSSNTWSLEAWVRTDWFDFIKQYCLDQIVSSQTAVEVLHSLKEEKVFNFGQLRSEELLRTHGRYVLEWPLRVFCKYLDTSNVKQSLNEAMFSQIYEQFYRAWVDPYENMTLIAPLRNFHSPLDSIELENGAKIVRLQAEEKTNIWESVWKLGIGSIEVFAAATHYLTISYKQKRDEENATNIFTAGGQLAREVITALRLIHVESVGVAEIYFFDPIGIYPSRELSLTLIDLISSEHARSKTYTFDESDVPVLKETIKLLNSSHKFKAIATAISQYNFSYSRTRHEDIIIDLAIALESTLLYGEFDELKYRLSLRGAAILARTVPPATSSKFLKALYDVRSEIVHSGNELGNINPQKRLKMEPSAFTHEALRTVSSVLREYLNQLNSGKSMPEIQSELDNRILSGLTVSPDTIDDNVD